jgi:hypothetical protein
MQDTSDIAKRKQVILALLQLVAVLICWMPVTLVLAQESATQHEPRWWKGNLHTHTFWSDGNDFPEMVAGWYADHGYNFLTLTDHNVLSRGMRWVSIDRIIRQTDSEIMDRYRARWGDAWVEVRQTEEREEVRLKPLDEFRCLLEQAGRFIMIEGEEISDRAEGKPVHLNATNLEQVLLPAGGTTVRESIRNNLRMMLVHQDSSGRQVLPHLNHPNFGYAVTAADLAVVVEEQFFEVYNGHPDVNHLGDESHLGVETIWDVVNTMRLLQLDAEPILGIATDDSHEYHGRPGSRPGRGWVMVRSRYLTPEHLILAMKAADFYASSGVVLDDVVYDSQQRRLDLTIAPTENATFETQFIAVMKPEKPVAELEQSGSARDQNESGSQENLPKAQVVATVPGLNPSYQLTGEELYVRAVVSSSLPPVDPVFDGQRQQAWTQPVGWQVGSTNNDRD